MVSNGVDINRIIVIINVNCYNFPNDKIVSYIIDKIINSPEIILPNTYDLCHFINIGLSCKADITKEQLSILQNIGLDMRYDSDLLFVGACMYDKHNDLVRFFVNKCGSDINTRDGAP